MANKSVWLHHTKFWCAHLRRRAKRGRLAPRSRWICDCPCAAGLARTCDCKSCRGESTSIPGRRRCRSLGRSYSMQLTRFWYMPPAQFLRRFSCIPCELGFFLLFLTRPRYFPKQSCNGPIFEIKRVRTNSGSDPSTLRKPVRLRENPRPEPGLLRDSASFFCGLVHLAARVVRFLGQFAHQLHESVRLSAFRRVPNEQAIVDKAL
jgi:hypothetical protein